MHKYFLNFKGLSNVSWRLAHFLLFPSFSRWVALAACFGSVCNLFPGTSFHKTFGNAVSLSFSLHHPIQLLLNLASGSQNCWWWLGRRVYVEHDYVCLIFQETKLKITKVLSFVQEWCALGSTSVLKPEFTTPVTSAYKVTADGSRLLPSAWAAPWWWCWHNAHVLFQMFPIFANSRGRV